jgi:hypothetical protein
MRTLLALFVFLLTALVVAEESVTDRVRGMIKQRKADKVGRKERINQLKLPFDEAYVKQKFGIPADAKLPVQPMRLRNLTQDQFAYYASRGQPVIVEDSIPRYKVSFLWFCLVFDACVLSLSFRPLFLFFAFFFACLGRRQMELQVVC